MLWAVLCIDRTNSEALRDETRTIHREYLDEKRSDIFFSGPLLSDDASQQTGSLFILSVRTRAEAQAFIDPEPFNRAGVFANIQIFRMRKGRFNPDMADGRAP